MVLNMGPSHPSTHGVLRIILELDGEIITKATPDVGYLHRGDEKIAENMTYTQFIPYTDRLDYLAPLANNVAYALAVEKLLGIEKQLPPRCQFIRVICCELARISAHLLGLGSLAMDLGAVTVFVLAGGKSTRMGTDKAFVTLNGRSLLDRMLDLGRSVTSNVRLIGDARKYFFHAPFAQKFFTRLQTQPALGLMGNQIEDRLAVARDHDRLALLDQPGESGQPVLGVLYRYRRHVTRIATGSYRRKWGITSSSAPSRRVRWPWHTPPSPRHR